LIAFAMVIAVAAGADADTLRIAWDRSVSDVSGYVVHVGNESGNYTHTFDVRDTDTFELSTVVPGQRYCFAVTAYAGATTSALSNEICGYSNVSPTLTAPDNRSDLVNVSVSLTAVLSPNRTVAFYDWDFNGDGVLETAPDANPTVTTVYPDERVETATVAVLKNGRTKLTDSITFQTLRCP
jgi:hypothetical protein